MADTKFKFDELKKMIDVYKRELPVKLAAKTQNYFVKSFSNQGWNGKKWQEVKRRIPGTQEYKYPKKKDLGRRKRPILIGKGSTKLRRAVVNSVRVKEWPIVRLVVDLVYARRHNEGLDGMPERKFMGHTSELEKQHISIIKQLTDKLFKDHKDKLK